MIELLKTNMKTERELLQLIIDELNEKLDKKEKENMQLLMTISQLKQSLEPKVIQNVIPPSQNNNKIPEINGIFIFAFGVSILSFKSSVLLFEF